jgi:hypothetical protein
MKRAIILGGVEAGRSAANMRRLLEFFGVPASIHTPAECWKHALASPKNGESFVLLGCAGSVLRFLDKMEEQAERGQFWGRGIHSVFVCNEGPAACTDALVKKISKDGKGEIQSTAATEFRISPEANDFCGPMAGVHCSVSQANGGMGVLKAETAETLISCAEGPVFAKMMYKNVALFFSTGGVLDIDAELAARDFDIRDHFLPATPIVMFVKWAFAESCFQPPETNACLIIDDPPLKPRYGFVNFQYLNELMSRHRFSCSLAFIPWNWRRSDSRVVRLFKENPERFSLSVHGCDHTRREFAIQNSAQVRWKVLCATQRMKRHEFRTGLRHDPVMVFPQGAFSRAAMRALKGSEFIGVVNSEVISKDPVPHHIKISDFWETALMNYDNFPIFTRRYPWQGLENFAFDILLGKPCIAVVHQNDCHDECRHVVDFIDRLNQLNVRLAWRDLGALVRRSFRQRKLKPDVLEIEMFGKEILLENFTSETKRFCVRKRESFPEQIEEVRAGTRAIEWTADLQGICFSTELGPGRSQMVRTLYKEFSENSFTAENSFAGGDMGHWVKTTFRRYLCEIRDNYVMGKSFSQTHDGDGGHLPGSGLPATTG